MLPGEPTRYAIARPFVPAGRDTGDGQWFINLVDNPLLDHEFTIFGRIDGGQAIAERILEGDRIERMEILESEER